MKLSFLLRLLSAIAFLGGFASTSPAAPISYRTTLTVTTPDSWAGPSTALPEYLEVEDRFDLQFTLNGAATYTSHEFIIPEFVDRWTFSGALTGLSLHPFAENAGSFGSTAAVLNPDASKILISKGITNIYTLEFFFELASPLQLGFSYPSGPGGEGPIQTTVGSTSRIKLTMFPRLPAKPGETQPLSEILSSFHPFHLTAAEMEFFSPAFEEGNPEARFLFMPMTDTIHAIPEPGIFALIGAAGAAMLLFRKRQR